MDDLGVPPFPETSIWGVYNELSSEFYILIMGIYIYILIYIYIDIYIYVYIICFYCPNIMGESLWSYGDLTLCFLFDGPLKQGCSKLLKVDHRQAISFFPLCVGCWEQP